MNVTFLQFDVVDYDEYFESEFLNHEDMETRAVLIPSHKLCECTFQEVEEGLTLIAYDGLVYLSVISINKILELLGFPIFYAEIKQTSN